MQELPVYLIPAKKLVRQAYEAGIEVTSLPGPAACITALTMSGLPTRRFAFEAFLPTDKKKRATVLEELSKETRTIILYEAPHHLQKTLQELFASLGNRNITLCKELTKRHENAFRTTLEHAISYYEGNEPKGEYVLVIQGKSHSEIIQEQQAQWEELSIEEHLQIYLDKDMSKKDAMKAVAKDRGISKREVYQALL